MVHQLNIKKMKFDELKDILRLRGLTVSGNKSELKWQESLVPNHAQQKIGSRLFPVILVPGLFSASLSLL